MGRGTENVDAQNEHGSTERFLPSSSLKPVCLVGQMILRDSGLPFGVRAEAR